MCLLCIVDFIKFKQKKKLSKLEVAFVKFTTLHYVPIHTWHTHTKRILNYFK